MIALRSFTENDALILQQKQYPTVSIGDIIIMISSWNAKIYNGKYFEVFAITENTRIVGSISLYERSKSIASVGVEVFSDERCKGYASEGMKSVLQKAKDLGFRILQDQVSADNKPSIALHERAGFETDGYIYKNAKNHNVLLYTYCL